MRYISTLLVLCLTTIMQAQSTVKTIYIPKELRDNNFESDTSKWSFSRKSETENFVIFWERGFAGDLAQAPDLDGHNMKVDLHNLESKLESFYAYFKDTLQFVQPGSKSERYKMMVMLNYSLEGTAYGGDYDNEIGALWVAPNRIQDKDLNCIAHEIGHSFQSQITCDGKGEAWGGGGIFEMASQWMLWQVNPRWIFTEPFHWTGFIKQMHLPFLAGENIYHSPYVLEYWSMQHGKTVIADLFRNGRKGEDPASTYMRMFNLSNEQFALQLLDCYSRLITFDLPGRHEVNRPYWLQFVSEQPVQMPQTFGTNVIELDRKEGKLNLKFQSTGNASTDGNAYRLVFVDGAGKAQYTAMSTKPLNVLKAKIPSGTAHAYLVVVGYPKDTYTPVANNPYAPKKDTATRTYPYTIEVK